MRRRAQSVAGAGRLRWSRADKIQSQIGTSLGTSLSLRYVPRGFVIGLSSVPDWYWYQCGTGFQFGFKFKFVPVPGVSGTVSRLVLELDLI